MSRDYELYIYDEAGDQPPRKKRKLNYREIDEMIAEKEKENKNELI